MTYNRRKVANELQNALDCKLHSIVGHIRMYLRRSEKWPRNF